MTNNYSDDKIKTIEWNEHIRLRPGMYIGKLGDGTQPDDGIYILLKEVIDNCIDEYTMGFGKKVDITIDNQRVSIRDYGRGVPLGKVVDVASKINTGAKYDNDTFKKSVGLNGVGLKAVNALSSFFKITSFREKECVTAEFTKGLLVNQDKQTTNQSNGTLISFEADNTVFETYQYNFSFVEQMLRNYTYLNAGLKIYLNGKEFVSQNGLLDLLNENLNEEPLYSPIHLKNGDIEVVFTHGTQYGEIYYSFANGQYTTQGGTHLVAYKEALVRTIKEFYKKDFDPSDIRSSIVAAISLKIEDPVFESQTKTKLGSKDMSLKGSVSVRSFVSDFLKSKLDDFLHKNPAITEVILKKIQENEKDRKAISGIQKLARERAKKSSLHNKKLRDCRIHFTDTKNELSPKSTIFITEGDSASGSITKSRDVDTQAVFSLKGKPLNCFGMTKKVVYENEEFNLLQAALDIEQGLDTLRYNRVVIATDADDDGMHIRLLTISFFLQFFPELIHNGHLYILQTPLFRVRNKKETRYCYTEKERQKAVTELKDHEITRFKGLGEISPSEFKEFIVEDKIRLEKVRLSKEDVSQDLLEFYMGKNTLERQDFIIENLIVEETVAV